MRLLVSEKAFQNKGAVLRPFSSRDAESEGIRVGKELGMHGHALSTQTALLEKEFLFLLSQKMPRLPFRLCTVPDAFDLFLALSRKKPATMIQHGGLEIPFLRPTLLSIGDYSPIYAKVFASTKGADLLILSRGLDMIEQLDRILSTIEKTGKISKANARAQGLALGYPESAIESYTSFAGRGEPLPAFIRFLLEHNITLTPALWNAPYVPTISGGKILELEHLEFWNSVVAKDLGPFAFDAASAHNKVSLVEMLISNSRGETSWAEDPAERRFRKALEGAYGT